MNDSSNDTRNVLNLILKHYSKIVPENRKLVWTIGKK